MANMSYCRFENTLDALKDCKSNWNNKTSDLEKSYRSQLLDLCEEIVDEFREPYYDDNEWE